MAAEQHFCERHHRPAVASRVRTLARTGPRRSSISARSTSPRSGWRTASAGAASSTTSSRTSSATRASRRRRERAAPQRQVERVDVTQFFSDATRSLLQRAARTALEWGSLDLDTDHLLYAALQDDVVRHVLDRSTPTRRRSPRRSRRRPSAASEPTFPRHSPGREGGAARCLRRVARARSVVCRPRACAARARSGRRDAGGPAPRSGSASRTRGCGARSSGASSPPAAQESRARRRRSTSTAAI